MKIGKKYELTCWTGFIDENYSWVYVLPALEYRHKYWYQWDLSLSWGKKCIVLTLIKNGDN